MSESTDMSEPSIETRNGLLYDQWQRASRHLDYEQWRKNQLGVGFEQWILHRPGVEYEQWIKNQLGKDYERLIAGPLSVKAPPRSHLEVGYWEAGFWQLVISFLAAMSLFVLAEIGLLFGLSDLAVLGVVWNLVIWPFMLIHERDMENRIAALESRPEDTTDNLWRHLAIGYRRRMKVSKFQGYQHLATFVIAAVVSMAGLTVFAVELLDNI